MAKTPDTNRLPNSMWKPLRELQFDKTSQRLYRNPLDLRIGENHLTAGVRSEQIELMHAAPGSQHSELFVHLSPMSEQVGVLLAHWSCPLTVWQ